MLETVEDEKIAEKALKRDGYRCSSCRLTPLHTVLAVVWSTESVQVKDRTLRNAVTLCPECQIEPACFRLASRFSGYSLNVEEIAARTFQLEQYQKLEAKKALAEKKLARSTLAGLVKGYHWKDDQLRGTKDFIAKLGIEDVQKAISIADARNSFGTPDEKFKYFCGICWNWIKET